jgi:endonuclease/exonuclease/phosphatase family metal-dependent hydrolase
MQVKFLTFNAALQDVRIFSRSVYCPVGHLTERLSVLPGALLGLDADVLFLQEVFHRDIQEKLYGTLKHSYPYITGISKGGLKLRLGNELLTISKYPLSHGTLVRFNRAALEENLFTSKGFFHTSMAIPEIGQIELINFHTTAGGVHAHPEDDRMNTIRMHQIDQILEYAACFKNVMLAGDLNAGPHTSMLNYQRMLNAELVDLSVQSNRDAVTWDTDNPLVVNGGEHHLPSQSIDHIFITKSLSDKLLLVNSEIVLDKKCIRTNGTMIPLSDHYGVMTVLETI